MENQTLEFAVNGDIAAVDAIMSTLTGAGHPCAELVDELPEQIWPKVQKLTVSMMPNGDPVYWVELISSEEAIGDVVAAIKESLPDAAITVKMLDGDVVRVTVSCRRAVKHGDFDGDVVDGPAFKKVLEEPAVPPREPTPTAAVPSNAMKIAVGASLVTALVAAGVYFWKKSR